LKRAVLRLFFGGDDLVRFALHLLSLRSMAVARHAANKQLESELTAGKEELATLTTSYNWARVDLEKAFQLELD
jgi:hypothetical protein